MASSTVTGKRMCVGLNRQLAGLVGLVAWLSACGTGTTGGTPSEELDALTIDVSGDLAGVDLAGVDIAGLDIAGLDIDIAGLDIDTAGLDLAGGDAPGTDDVAVDTGEDVPVTADVDVGGADAGTDAQTQVDADVQTPDSADNGGATDATGSDAQDADTLPDSVADIDTAQSSDATEDGGDASIGCSADVGCASGVCVEGVCVSVICTPADVTCTDATMLQTCNSTGTAWDASACGDQKACADGACVALVCAPGSITCQEGDRVQCNALGTAWVADPCGGNEVCDQSACKPVICDAGKSFCDGSTAKLCDWAGVAVEASEECTTVAGGCKDGACYVWTCTPGSQACASATELQTCSTDGTGWESAPCPDGNGCWAGACAPIVCLANAVSCTDAQQTLVCADNGTAWAVDVACAASGKVCLGGGCVACTPGTHACDGAVLKSCGPTGEWVDTDCADQNACTVGTCDAELAECVLAEKYCDDGNPCTHDACDIIDGCVNTPEVGICPDGQVCSGDTCVNPVCAIGQTTCVNNLLSTCKADQLGWIFTPCDGANVCVGNSCEAKVCVPESQYCVGKEIWVCDLAGVAPEKLTNCGGFGQDWGCYQGMCVQQVCQPDEVVCASTTIISTCKPDGTGYTTATCPAETGCHDGQCKPVICDPGDTLCINDQVVTCNAGGTSSTVVEDCAGDGKICTNLTCLKCIPGGTTCVGGKLYVCNDEGDGTSVFNCDDGDACTLDTCAGYPPLCAHPANLCDDGNVCTLDACVSISGCTYSAAPGSCDDGSACTQGDTCVGTACVAASGGTVNSPGVGSGVAGSVDGTGASAQINAPSSACLTPDGSLVVADTGGNRIRRLSSAGELSMWAGSGTAGSLDGALTTAQFNGPKGVACAADGSVYVADTGGNRLRKISGSTVASLAGGGVAGFVDGVGAAAKFSAPSRLVIDPAGNLIVSDTGNSAIRRVTPGGSVSTLIGVAGAGHLDGPGYIAKVTAPVGLAFGPDGTLYIADTGNHRIRALAPSGVLSTLYGSGTAGYSIADGVAGQLNAPAGLSWHSSGHLIVADTLNHRIRAIWPNGTNGAVAGSGTSGFANGIGDLAAFASPQDVVPAWSGAIAVMDTKNNRIRTISTNAKTCDDGQPCTADACDPVSGECVYTAIAEGGECTDGNRCTTGDVCDASGKCVGKAANCNDGNVCTDDACDKYTGECRTVFNGAACTDSNPCTTGAKCAGGVCGLPTPCDDGDICTADSCDATGCKHTTIGNCCASDSFCQDGSSCTADKCVLTCDGTVSGSSCYKAFAGAATWAEAVQACAAWGGTLATVGSAAENTVVANVGLLLSGSADFWIGLTDSGAEGTFQWLDGTAGSYANWNTNEPNNLTTLCGSVGEDVGVMTVGGKWSDKCATEARGNWVCERPMPGGTCSHTVVGQCCTANGECDDGNACTTDKCENGGCLNTALPDGGSCGSGMMCSGGDCLTNCQTTADCAGGHECTSIAGAVNMCQDFQDDFAGLSGKWKFVGSAKLDTPGGRVILTNSAKNNAGIAWLTDPYDFRSIEVSWTLRASNPGNPASDGWGMILQDGQDSSKVGAGGSGVGLTGLTGLGVRFNHRGSGTFLSVQRMVAPSTSTTLCATQGPNFSTSADRKVVVRVQGGKLKLTIDGTQFLNCDVRADLPQAPGLIGFSAGTGAEYAQHMIDDVTVRHPCTAKSDAACSPHTCGDGYKSGQFEECDDGNTATGDGCSGSCLYEFDNAWNTYLLTTLSLGSNEIPQQAHVGSWQGKTPDGTTLVSASANNTVVALRAWALAKTTKTLQFTAGHDDNAILFIDDKSVGGASFGNTLSINTTLTPGWHKLEWLLYNAGGATSLAPSKKMASMVDGLSSGPK